MTVKQARTTATSSFTTGSRALALAAVAALGTGGAARAEAPSVEKAQLEAQASRSASFDIPAQPLSQALTAFGRQSGLQIAVNAASVAGKTSSGVSGTMGVEQALRQLLAGTGVPFRFTSDNAVTVSSAAAGDSGGAMQLDPVSVQGVFPVPAQAMIDNLPPPYAGGQVATGGQLGLLGNRGVMDTPFNQTSYTAKKVQDQQAKTIKDVLIDDPSVRGTSLTGGPGVEGVTIRGFSNNNSEMSYGGLYGLLPVFSSMAELAERVEVLKGPSVLLNGMPPGGSIGGTINIVPKRAPDDGLTQLTTNFAGASQFGVHADVARRFGPDKQFGVRFNGAFRAGQTMVAANSDQRGLGVLGLDLRGERVRLSADFGYQHQYIGAVISYLALNDNVPLPWAPDPRKNLGQPWGYNEYKDLFGVARAEFDITERITAYAAAGAHDNRFNSLYSSIITLNSFNGAATANGAANISQYRTFQTGEAGLRALIESGPIGHEVAVTATTFANQFGTGSAFLSGVSSNIYNPTIIAQPSVPTMNARKTSITGLSSLGVADTLSVAAKRIQLTVGARLQQVTSTNYNATTGAPTASYDQSAVSPAVAVVVKPWQNVSIYGNYIQGLQQGTVVTAPFANAGMVFPPYVSTQYEAGVKVDWGKLTTTASVFQIAQPSILTDVASNTRILGGEQKNQGLELNFFGEPVPGIRVLGGAMFLNAVLAKTQGGATDGWTAPFAPAFNLNLAGEWDTPFVPRLTLTGRAVYTGSQYIDTNLPRRSLPEWTRFDLGARYVFDNPGAKGKPLVARFDVENVFDVTYWGGSGSSTLWLGAPRTFRLSLTADF